MSTPSPTQSATCTGGEEESPRETESTPQARPPKDPNATPPSPDLEEAGAREGSTKGIAGSTEDTKDENKNNLVHYPTEQPVDATEQENEGFFHGIWRFMNDNPVISGIIASVVAGVILAVILPVKLSDDDADLPTPAPSLEPTLKPNYEWQQIGQTLPGGSVLEHWFGHTVDITTDGQVVLVTARLADMTLLEAYQWQPDSGAWRLHGSPIRVPVEQSKSKKVFSNDAADRLVFFSRSHDGTYLSSVGRVEVFGLNQNAWVSDSLLNITRVFNNYSWLPVFRIWDAAVAPDGNKIALTLGLFEHTSNNTVQVYSNVGGQLLGHGSSLVDPRGESGFGHSIALSRDADVLAIGCPGYVWVYHYGYNDWVEPGFELIGDELSTSWFGAVVAISRDGSTVAVGDPNSHGNAGSIIVYRFDEKKLRFEKLGKGITRQLNSQQKFHLWSSGITMSENGDIVGVTGWFSTEDDCVNFFAAFQFNHVTRNWDELAIITSGNGTYYFSCTMSGDGMVLACGSSPQYAPLFADGEAVVVYELTEQ